MEDLVLITYLVGAVTCAGAIIWSGVSGRWSKDDWPMFAITVPWFWPLLLPVALIGTFAERNSCKCYWEGDNPRCAWHGDGRFILPGPSTKRLARKRGLI